MVKINNFDIINHLLNFDSEDDFFYIQIIKRRKDNPELPRSEKMIKTYCVRKDGLEKIKDSIIESCKSNNARAYISLNKRNYKDIALKMNMNLAQYLYDSHYRGCERLFDSVCGEIHSDKNKKWIVDIDTHDENLITAYKILVSELQSSKDNIMLEIPTLNGIHLITSPFNLDLFKKNCVSSKIDIPDIHKNNATLLYFEGESLYSTIKKEIVGRILKHTKNIF